ncbi:hypothetical protein [Methylobacterium sp. C1]|uniref:hypothetical protein n=1 Tax=Methylobacterium sp. C1 TaxID=1479019 RepID=UPI000A8698F4|nr:hypothetical protein [Methylobacterium sp. C1]
MQQHIETAADRREALASLALHVLKLACAGQVNPVDAAAVSDAIRLIRSALPEPEEASDAA